MTSTKLTLVLSILSFLHFVSAGPIQATTKSAVVDTIHVIRVDIDNPFSKHRQFVDTELPNITPGEFLVGSAKAESSEEPLTQPFVVNLGCKFEPEICEKVKRVFESAGRRIAESIRFYQPVIVQATYGPFCPSNQPNCPQRNTLGQAASSSFFSCRRPQDDKFAYFPQSLIKQLLPNVSLTFSNVDIFADFNSDKRFWFKEDNTPIDPTQTDFEYVVAHELTHGLGFDTDWTQWSSTYKVGGIPSNFLAPSLNLDQNGRVISWQPVNIFDRFVFESKSLRPLSNYLGDIYKTRPKAGSTISSFYGEMVKSKISNIAGEAVYNSVTSGRQALQFRVNRTSIATVLNTNQNRFDPGSSIAHLDPAMYSTSPDFLMVPSITNSTTGISLDDIIARNSRNGEIPSYGVYGPYTVWMLSELGWPSVMNSERATLEVLSNPAMALDSGSYRMGMTSLSAILVLLVVV